ncbi:MAG TPA: hypothetical protein DCL54_10720 [Alphaproteobacteria bacterium]|nr:hypothetical protein [Alphaproteobacteria bacterium]HAJ47041.1 hypothetical protein [Alphaproteobacteria bacterium]
MIDPDDLLTAAQEHLTRRRRGAPRQTQLRRVVSDLYYAMFHELCRQITTEFLANARRKDQRFRGVYRALNHGSARDTCQYVVKDPSKSDEERQVARTFLRLQQARFSADYDPIDRFYLSTVVALRQDTEAAIELLRANFPGKADLLTRLIFKDR